MMHSRIADLLSVIEDVTRVYADPKDDVIMIRSIKNNLKEMEEGFLAKEVNVKEIINGIFLKVQMR